VKPYVISDIQRRVNAMNVEATLEARGLPFNLNHSPELPVLQCNMTRVDEWKRLTANIKVVKHEERMKHNEMVNFTTHAMEAVRRTIRAFRLAKVPLMLAGGTLLGWYRECGIIAHTEDLDFASISDHIVSMDHFNLLMVGLRLDMTHILAHILYCRSHCTHMVSLDRFELTDIRCSLDL
jgi:hypothetical protein